MYEINTKIDSRGKVDQVSLWADDILYKFSRFRKIIGCHQYYCTALIVVLGNYDCLFCAQVKCLEGGVTINASIAQEAKSL